MPASSLLQDWIHGMLLAVAAGQPWLLMNCALAAWNAYVPLMHKQRYAELAGVALPLLKQLLQVSRWLLLIWYTSWLLR